jgi:transketolase
MAIAERFLRENFDAEMCDHYTYGICGDGDLMEGVSYEAASIAAHLGLGRLIFLWDDNSITIDGAVGLSHSENVQARLAATGWHVQAVDGHDAEAIAAAIEVARGVTSQPSLIACRTVIGQGSPSYEGTSRTHGAALGVDEVRATKERIGLDPDAFFATPDDVVSAFRAHDGAAAHQAWNERIAAHPRADEFMSWVRADGAALAGRVSWPTFEAGAKLATRKASLSCLKAIVDEAPWFVGGSADLAGSNGTQIGLPMFTADSFKDAATINFGIREHAMGAICNGMVLHGGVRPYSATFLMFHDYQRPSVRLSGLMNVPVTWIYTHDSVFLGEDGPTHQPIATLLALRAIPNMEVWRPGDANETIVSWRAALERYGPTSLILTRQALPVIGSDTSGAAMGGYVLVDLDGTPDVCLLGTGSEVATCMDAAKVLASRGISARVVSLPCRERFWGQSAEYKASVLPAGIPRVSVEAGVTLGWERWTGENAAHVGIDTYGHSAPAGVIAEKLGFTGENVANIAQRLVG